MSTVNRLLLTVVACGILATPVMGQNIKGHYVSKSDQTGTIYHTFPTTLFEAPRNGELTFDITYKSNGDGLAVINFTCEMEEGILADSVCFTSGRTEMDGPVKKLYISPEKKRWTHRYTFSADVNALYTFFDASTTPQVVLYRQGNERIYEVKPSAWKSTAPVMDKIFQMIRINDAQ